MFVPHRRHITSLLWAQQVNAIYRFVTMVKIITRVSALSYHLVNIQTFGNWVLSCLNVEVTRLGQTDGASLCLPNCDSNIYSCEMLRILRSPKRRFTYGLHGAIFEKVATLITAAVITWIPETGQRHCCTLNDIEPAFNRLTSRYASVA
jgi:hypothetical protein